MKKIIYILFLSFSVFACAEPLKVLGVSLKINKKCNIEYINKLGKKGIVNLGMPVTAQCKFVLHDSTNIINISRITNAYMLFVYYPYQHNDQCMSKYTAVVIENSGNIRASKYIKRSGYCPKSVEQKEFEYFAYKMKILK